MLNFIGEFIEFVLIALLVLSLLALKFLIRDIHYRQWKQAVIEQKQKKETQQSLEELAYNHSRYYPYIREMIPETVRLHLSKYRGKRKALSWRIKLLQLLGVVDPHAAKMLMEEYMITAETPARPIFPGEWACSKCGTTNPDTALFCKDCGEYK